MNSDDTNEVVTEPAEEQTSCQPEEDALVPLLKRIAELEEQLQLTKVDAIRAQAEAQNVIRRQRATLEEEIKFAPKSLVDALLPVLDNFERTRGALDAGSSTERILEGIDAVERQLRAALSQVQVERIASIGVAFDPEKHEALLTETGTGQPDHTILSELEAGYTMYGRVVRPARVKVAVEE